MAANFRKAVDEAPHISLAEGLRAVPRGEGRDRIDSDANVILGSANIDAGCLERYPNSSRWDFVIGAAGAKHPRAVFVEVHSADASGVSEVERKLLWLQKTYLELEGATRLASLPGEFHWVASGRIKIPKNTPQYRRIAALRRRGLQGPSERLTITRPGAGRPS